MKSAVCNYIVQSRRLCANQTVPSRTRDVVAARRAHIRRRSWKGAPRHPNDSTAAGMRVSLGGWSAYLARLRTSATRVACPLSTADSAAVRKGSATVTSISKRGPPSGSAATKSITLPSVSPSLKGKIPLASLRMLFFKSSLQSWLLCWTPWRPPWLALVHIQVRHKSTNLARNQPFKCMKS
jgi:hypothetical protein